VLDIVFLVVVLGLLNAMAIHDMKPLIAKVRQVEAFSLFSSHRTSIVEQYTVTGLWPDGALDVINARDEGDSIAMRSIRETLAKKKANSAEDSIEIKLAYGILPGARPENESSVETAKDHATSSTLAKPKPLKESDENRQWYGDDIYKYSGSGNAITSNNSYLVINGAITYWIEKLSNQQQATFLSISPVMTNENANSVWFSCSQNEPRVGKKVGPVLTNAKGAERLSVCAD